MKRLYFLLLIAMMACAGLGTTVTSASASDSCSSIKRHDDMANCYFKAHNWAKVIQAYKTTPPHSLDYPTDDLSNAADVRMFYQYAVAYEHLRNMEQARSYISLAEMSLHPKPQAISKFYADTVIAEFKKLKASPAIPPEQIAQQHTDAQWARDQGMSDEEVELVKFRGRPCHIESFDSGDNYHKQTFWYCDADGKYEEAYTFVNGHQTDHYQP